MTIIRYTVADNKDLDNESSEYDSYNAAKAAAQDRRGIVMMYTYEFDDSVMVDDFTSDDDEEGDPVYELR